MQQQRVERMGAENKERETLAAWKRERFLQQAPLPREKASWLISFLASNWRKWKSFQRLTK
jgi:hypothetical protein